MNVRRSALVARPVGQMFDLIEAAEDYPLFLPWCAGATIVSRDDEIVSADLLVRVAGIGFEMRTRNPKRRPEYMAIHLERGPFRRFEGEWHLRALGDEGCKVEFVLDYEFDSRLMSQAASPLFGHAATTLMDAFVERAMAMPARPAQAPSSSPSSPVPSASTALPAPPGEGAAATLPRVTNEACGAPGSH